MLPTTNRLSRAGFTAFTNRSDLKTVYNRLGTLKFTAGTTKFTVVTSGKHEKRAVVRNKLRRRVYSQISVKKPSITGVLYASKQSYTLSFDEIKTLLDRLLQDAQKTL